MISIQKTNNCQSGVWDTIFDIVSLCFSIGDVITNPIDPWAWVGLAGDIIDLVPFVTGVGEAKSNECHIEI